MHWLWPYRSTTSEARRHHALTDWRGRLHKTPMTTVLPTVAYKSRFCYSLCYKRLDGFAYTDTLTAAFKLFTYENSLPMLLDKPQRTVSVSTGFISLFYACVLFCRSLNMFLQCEVFWCCRRRDNSRQFSFFLLWPLLSSFLLSNSKKQLVIFIHFSYFMK